MLALVAVKQSDDGISSIIVRDNEPKPILKKSDYVLVKVYYAGMNPFDIQLVQGLMGSSAPVTPPFICGRDFCGKIIEVGNKVKNFKIGDFVCGQSYTYYGSMAQYLKISSSRICKFDPIGIPLTIAASIPCIGQTAWQSLIVHGKLNCNHKLLILGGTTQCGIIAVQIAKNIVKVKNITVTSSKTDYCLNILGVDRVFNYRNNEIWYEELNKNKDDKFDIIFDCIGGNESYQNAIKYNILKDKNSLFITIVGDDNSGKSWTNFMKTGYKYIEMKGKQNLDDVIHFVNNGKILPLIDKNGIFQFDEKAIDLFKYAKNGKGFGKCLLKIFDDTADIDDEKKIDDDVDDDMNDSNKKNVIELKWDPVHNGKNIDFKNNNKQVKGRFGWNICIADTIIFKSDYNEYEWNITCNDIGSGKFCMGFIDKSMYIDDDYKDVIPDWNIWIGKYKSRLQYSVYINKSNDYFVLDGGYNGLNNIKYTLNNGNGCKFKNGDIFRFKVDFQKGTVELFYNNDKVGIIFDNIPDNIIPTVSLYKKCDLTIS